MEVFSAGVSADQKVIMPKSRQILKCLEPVRIAQHCSFFLHVSHS